MASKTQLLLTAPDTLSNQPKLPLPKEEIDTTGNVVFDLSGNQNVATSLTQAGIAATTVDINNNPVGAIVDSLTNQGYSVGQPAIGAGAGAGVMGSAFMQNFTEYAMVTVVFIVSAAIIRTLFNRFWNNIPKENRNSWKNSLKKRFNSNKKADASSKPDGHESFNPNSNQDHGPYSAMNAGDDENPAKNEESKG